MVDREGGLGLGSVRFSTKDLDYDTNIVVHHSPFEGYPG